jgi:hypothetical protein
VALLEKDTKNAARRLTPGFLQAVESAKKEHPHLSKGYLCTLVYMAFYSTPIGHDPSTSRRDRGVVADAEKRSIDAQLSKPEAQVLERVSNSYPVVSAVDNARNFYTLLTTQL